MLGPGVYRALFAQYYIMARIKNVPIIYFTFAGLISCILSIGLALGVIFAVRYVLLIGVIEMKENFFSGRISSLCSTSEHNEKRNRHRKLHIEKG